MIFRTAVLDQSPLQGLFVRISDHKDLFQGQRIKTGVIHAGRDRARGRIKVLDLVGMEVVLVEIFRQGHGIRQGAARMRGHEIGHQVLVASAFFIGLDKGPDKVSVDPVGRLAHFFEDRIGNVLGSHPELAADMIAAELIEEGPVLIGQDIVKADPGPDKDLFDTRQGPEGS